MAAVYAAAGLGEASAASLGSETIAGPPERLINMLESSRSVEDFQKLGRISAGTYGVVYKCAS